LGPNLIQETSETIRKFQEHIQTAQSRYKSYVDKRRRPLEFEVGDNVFLKVSPTKGVRRFGVRDNLSPKYIGPYEIIEKLNPVAYRLDLAVDLEHVHNVFQSQHRKYVPGVGHAIITEPITIIEDLAY